MKLSWIRYFPIVFGSMLFIACNSHKTNKAEDTTNPVFASDPGVKKITEQISKSPKDAELYFDRGGILHKMKMDTLALKDYKMAASIDSTKAKYYSAIGDVLFEHKDISGSLQWLQKAVALDPTDQKAHLKTAKLFLYLGDYASGFKEINIVLRKDPYNAEGYYLKGMLYKYMKDTAKAISSFQTSLQVAPEYVDAIMQLGTLYGAQKNPIALKYYDNAFKIDSSDIFPVFAKGVFYQNQKDYVQAKELFKQCIVRNTHYVDAYFHMGYILLQEDSIAKAYRQFDIVTKVDPSNSTAYYNRGLCSELMDSVKKAVEDYRKALIIDSSYQSPKDALKRLKVKI